MLGGQQVLPPKYVRSATVQNTTNQELTLHAQFEQNQQDYTLAPGASVVVEGSIDKGTWTACDPLQKIQVLANGQALGERLFSSQGGVLVLNLNVVQLEGGFQLQDSQ